MKIFYSDNHNQHNPAFEIFEGGVKTPYLENPDRLERMLSAMQNLDWIEILAPTDFGLGPVLAVHDADYVDYLGSAYEEWIRQGDDYKQIDLLPSTFPPRGYTHKPDNILGRAGYYTFDLSAPIQADTYRAALGAVNCALSGAKEINGGNKAAFALCRPPGHHAGKSFSGGYCYLNNSAIAANWLTQFGRVAILDIDYHAGNGTQDIFYKREDVFSVSIHADPSFEYPYYCGYANDTGAPLGENTGTGTGSQHNYPLPLGTGDAKYLSTLEDALWKIQSYEADFMVLSAGMDIYKDDPLGTFEITRDGIKEIGRAIASLKIPTLIVTEGGYDNETLGDNFISLISPFSL